MPVPENPAATPNGANSLWHPFGAMNRVRDHRTVITRGEDVWVWDDTGRRYFDGTAALWYSNVGHGRREIIDAVTRQLEQLDAYQIFGDFANEPALRLAAELAARAPVREGRIFFTSGGGDAADSAAKLARLYFQAKGSPERNHLIARDHCYHGTHGFGTALAGMAGNRIGAPFMPGVSFVAHDDAEALERELLAVGPERVAAFFLEPVIGAGGVRPPEPGYVERVAEICRAHGVLLIADAVICGFGRLGTWFAIERFDVAPDMILFAKGVTSGYQPLGGVVVAGHVAEPFWSGDDAPVFRHGQTYAGHPAACAAGLANLEVMERDGLLARSRTMEKVLFDALRTLEDHPLVDTVRGGVGFLGALELDGDRMTRQPDLPSRVFGAVREHGALIRPMGSAVGFSPPLTATEEHIDQLLESVKAGLDGLR
jgi:adenosylmethionine-8-amino-7-oxononanoate aminotransferase